MFGYTRFVNNGNRKQGVSGYTYFYDLLEFFRHPSIFGRTNFQDMRPFPEVSPSFSFVEVPGFDTTVIEFGGRSEQRIANDADVRWTYRARWSRLSPAQMQQILDFFVARRGSHQAFTFTHPASGVRKVVRFALDKAQIELFKFRLYRLHEVDLIEVDETLG